MVHTPYWFNIYRYDSLCWFSDLFWYFVQYVNGAFYTVYIVISYVLCELFVYSVFSAYIMYGVNSVHIIYSLYNLYSVYSVYSVYCVYSVYSRYSMYSVYSMYSMYSVYSVYSVISAVFLHLTRVAGQSSCLPTDMRGGESRQVL